MNSANERRSAIIIGVGPGLGRALAHQLATQDLHLHLLGRDTDYLETLAAEIGSAGGSADFHYADPQDPSALAEIVESLANRHQLEVVSYNAAAAGGRLIDTPVQDLRAASDVNLHSPVAAVRAARHRLAATSGKVMLTGGGLALHPSAEVGVLSVGKAMLRTAALLLAEDLKPDGITVRTLTIAGAISPGTDFDPGLIAARFWAVTSDPTAPTETLFAGTPVPAPTPAVR